MKISIFYGLYAGLLTIVYFVAFYLISPKLMLNPFIWWSSLLFYLFGMIGAVRKRTSQLSQKMSLRLALQTAFLVFVIANLIFYIFFFVLFGVIDPSLVDLQKEMMANNPAAAEQLNSKDFSVTLSGTFFNFLYSLIGGFLLALGIAATMKTD